MASQAIIDITTKYIQSIPKDKYHLSKAYLFGSYARNNENLNSDIDIALIFSNMNDRLQTQLELMKLRRNIDLRIEPHPFNENDFVNPDPLVTEILTFGLELKLI
jgi:predicted nucleotidyltransferase